MSDVSLVGPIAFIGLSKIRPTSAMDGVPIAEQRDQLKCGVAACGRDACWEIFDVQLLAGTCFPEIIGFQHDSILHTFVVPK